MLSCLLFLLLSATIDGRWLRQATVPAPKERSGSTGWCRRFLRAAGVEYSVEGVPPSSGAVVSNHMSYLDVMVYSAIRPFVMVAKREVRSWPLLGWLTAQAGTVYVDRSEDIEPGATRQTHAEVNAKMAEAYGSGLPVLFFPEGTTTDGSGVLPFRRGLFHSILNRGVTLRVAAIRLALGEGNGTATVGEDVCFVGDALFAPHLFRLLGLRGITARVVFGDEVVSRDDRFSLSRGAREEVVALYEGMEAVEGSTALMRMQTGVISIA